MKKAIDVDVTGTKAVSNFIKKYGNEANTLVKDLTQIAAKETAREAKVLVPVDTGKLRQSIKAEKQNNFSWFITAYESYARWVEYGLRSRPNYPAQPFMGPAWKFASKQYIEDLKTHFNRLAKKLGK